MRDNFPITQSIPSPMPENQDSYDFNDEGKEFSGDEEEFYSNPVLGSLNDRNKEWGYDGFQNNPSEAMEEKKEISLLPELLPNEEISLLPKVLPHRKLYNSHNTLYPRILPFRRLDNYQSTNFDDNDQAMVLSDIPELFKEHINLNNKIDCTEYFECNDDPWIPKSSNDININNFGSIEHQERPSDQISSPSFNLVYSSTRYQINPDGWA